MWSESVSPRGLWSFLSARFMQAKQTGSIQGEDHAQPIRSSEQGFFDELRSGVR